jgi:hypothetical protein
MGEASEIAGSAMSAPHLKNLARAVESLFDRGGVTPE